MPLPRIAWLVTVVALLIGALIMLLSHYQGYAAVFGAVAVSAAVNLR
jgi:ABC-type transporter Mla maintaining outer membrane lipid asymmetry permease subunit MlaE